LYARGKHLDERRTATAALGNEKKAPQALACEPDDVFERAGDKLSNRGFTLGGVVEVEDLHKRKPQRRRAFGLRQPREEIEPRLSGTRSVSPSSAPAMSRHRRELGAIRGQQLFEFRNAGPAIGPGTQPCADLRRGC
jgi:hypothetical protein